MVRISLCEKEDVLSLEQQPGRVAEPALLPPVDTHSGNRRVAAQASGNGMREMAGEAPHRVGRFPLGGVPGRSSRGVLPPLVPPLALPLRHVHPHHRCLRLHRLRIRCHQQGRWRGSF